MKTVFKKTHLPFIKHVLHEGEGRENWTLARMMQDRDGVQHQLPAELALLSRGAHFGDAWSMCELARTLFHHGGDLFLPSVLRLWKQAVLRNDAGARFDVENLPIYDRILSYRSADGSSYATMEMQCALLSEWYLTRLGLHPWRSLNECERRARCEELIRDACRVLRIPAAKAEFVSKLTFNGAIIDGLAHWEGKISVRAELFADLERLIEVVFHELGHLVAFQILKGADNGNELKALFGISDERVLSWQRNEMGYQVMTSEEDPDTLSYGVYTLWATFFLPPLNGGI